MAFGFAGAAAGAAESLDTLLAKRRAEALAQQELEQRRVTEARMRELADSQMAEIDANRAERERQTGRTEALERLALVPVGGIVSQPAVDAANQYGLGGHLRDEMITPSGPRLPGGSNENWEPYSTGVVRRIPTETERLLEAQIARERRISDRAEGRADDRARRGVAGRLAERQLQVSGMAASKQIPQEVVGIIKDISSGHGMAGNIPTRSEALQQFISNWGVITQAHPQLDVEDVRKMFNALLPETDEYSGAGGSIFGQTGSNNTASSDFTQVK